MERQTKIYGTLGPACREAGLLERMLRAGMDGVRINFSYAGEAGDPLADYRLFRAGCARLGCHLPVIGDLQGPRARLGVLPEGGLELHPGQRVLLGDSLCAQVPSGPIPLPVTAGVLPAELASGDRVLLDNGRVRLEVEALAAEGALCRVVEGGMVRGHQGLNFPGRDPAAPPLTPKDRADLERMIAAGFDYVALSFLRSAEDLRRVREIIDRAGSPLKLIAKIERPAALEALEPVLAASDGVIVARGDLGAEAGLEKVPLAQKRILRAARARGTFSLVATQLLESMRVLPEPTRAEVSDIANAVLDGAGGLLFTGETAAGAHPLAVVELAAKVISEVEASPEYRQALGR